MKATESKTTATAQYLQAKDPEQQPFFQKKEGVGILENGRTAFFSNVGSDDIHSKPFFSAPVIQTKLTIGAPDDDYEKETDAMADKVVQRLVADRSPMPRDDSMPGVQRLCAECGEEHEEGIAPKIQPKAIFESNEEGQVQRKCAACSEKKIQPMRTEDEPMIQGMGIVPDIQASSDLESRLNATKGSGSPLPDETRSSMESAFGTDFSGVRVHTNSGAVQMNQELGAQAFTHGSDVYFNSGKYDTGSREGNRLLGHELTHVVQQSKSIGRKMVQRQNGKKNNKQKRFSVLVPIDYTTLEQMYRLFERTAYGHEMNLVWECNAYCDMSKNKGKVVPFLVSKEMVDKYTDPKIKKERKNRRDEYLAMKGSIKGELAREADRRYYQKSGHVPGTKIKKNEEGNVQMWDQEITKILQEKEHLLSLPLEIKDALGGEKNFQPKDYEQLIRISKKLENLDSKDLALYRLQTMTNTLDALEAALNKASLSKGTLLEDPEELKRLFKIFQDKLADPEFSETGESWLRFAKFLDKNKDKIEGILHGDPSGKLTPEKIDKIILEFGEYIAAEPVDDASPDKLETLDDFDKQFKYDPGWQKLSKEDRKLLLEYAKASPEEIKEGKIDFAKVTTEMKISMALKLSDTTLLGEMGAAAKAAFTDPTFIITLIVIVAIYVGLWLTPEPSGITKLAAGILTIVLLAQFAWHDIYGFAKAWFALSEECSRATSVDVLKKSGDKFLKTIGPIGFDIALAIVMWGAGKAVGPKLSKMGIERATVRAETAVKIAETKPGSGGKTPTATVESPKLPDKVSLKDKTPSEILDIFESNLKPDGKRGLKKIRNNLGDSKVLEILEGQQNKGLDLDHFLAEKGISPEVEASARAELVVAKARLLRVKLLELELISDPVLRRSIQRCRKRLKSLENIKDTKKLESQKSEILNDLIGDLGEAFGQAMLKGEYAGKGHEYKVLVNIEAVIEVPGFKSIAEWKAAQIKAGNIIEARDLGRFREAQGSVWESLAEADAMVVKKDPSGKLQPVEIEQVKTGRGDKHSEASTQNTNFIDALKKIADGAKDIKLFEKVDKAQLGSERTGEFNLSDLSKIKKSTRATPEKTGFDKKLPDNREVLGELAKSILESGLPTQANPLPLPTTAPREQNGSGKNL
jgi:hypothetical protein